MKTSTVMLTLSAGTLIVGCMDPLGPPPGFGTGQQPSPQKKGRKR